MSWWGSSESKSKSSCRLFPSLSLSHSRDVLIAALFSWRFVRHSTFFSYRVLLVARNFDARTVARFDPNVVCHDLCRATFFLSHRAFLIVAHVSRSLCVTCNYIWLNWIDLNYDMILDILYHFGVASVASGLLQQKIKYLCKCLWSNLISMNCLCL